MTATGTFEVKLVPLSLDDQSANPNLGRMSIDKTFRGDIVARSMGEMLSARTPTPGSAGYVAIERVEGSLHDHEGTFVLQHSGTMSADGQHLSIVVVPDSGTGGLVGISGTMDITIENGQHLYMFEYELG